VNAKLLQPPCTVFALHGFWGAPSDYDGLRSSLAHKIPLKWEIPHLPGHGGEPLPAAGASIEALADWCEETMEKAGGDGRCVLMGYSLGARIALATAIRNPKNVIGLALISGSPGLENPEQRANRAEEDTRRAKNLASCKTREQLEKYLRQWWEQPVFQSPVWAPGLYEPYIGKRLEEDPSKLATILEQASPGRQKSLLHRLTELNIPVICIAGMEDRKYCEHADAMHRRINVSLTGLLPGAGHSLLLENPPSLSGCLSSWLVGC
jgi:2-succinyl-6-hydroxy-2,4-cyclohexadiene-1-carboxylate synthase